MAQTHKAFGDCEGPLGLPMRSVHATELEKLLASLPEECRTLRHIAKAPAAQDIVEGERADVSLIITGTFDRDREIMLPEGGDWKQFRKNPVVTFNHNYEQLPVGKALWVKRQKGNTPETDGWLAKTRYIAKPVGWEGGWFPDAVWHMIQSGDLPGKSIGFIPLDMREPTEKEVVERPELVKRGSRIIAKWLALEYAVAPIPTNPDALVTAVAKAKAAGHAVPDGIFDGLGIVLMDDAPLTLETLLGYQPTGEGEDHSKATQVTISGEEIKQRVYAAVTMFLKNVDIPQMVRDELNKVRGKV